VHLVLIVNKNSTAKPSIIAYTDPQWRGKTVIANPLFSTTTTRVARFSLSADQAFMNALKANRHHPHRAKETAPI
jgi:ABC-type Fe3+ transport system substrate-binding protein